MVGAEIATVAAAESHDPEKAIAKATQSVIFRVGTFYVGSIFLLVCIVPWNDSELGASPYVAAFKAMGIPYADDVMNAVVLTAVLSCLNSGLYTASRMLFVLAARREAPMRLITVNGRGVPVWAILASTVVGFLSVIAAYVSPDTVFTFLLNSSGAVILFVYFLIAVSQFVLRRRTPEEDLTVKMWFFPVLTILAAAGIVAVLVQMAFKSDTRSQLLLSLLSWGVVLVLYGVTRWRGGSVSAGGDGCRRRPNGPPRRSSCMANRTMAEDELHDALERIDGSDAASYLVVVPVNPVDTGTADREGAAFVWQATTAAAQERLDRDPGGAARSRPHRRGRARRLPPARRPRGGDEGVRARPRRHLDPARGPLVLAPPRHRGRRPGAVRRARPARGGAHARAVLNFIPARGHRPRMSAMRKALAASVAVFFACGFVLAIAQPDLLVQLLGLVAVVAVVAFGLMAVVETVRWAAARLGPRRRMN